MNKFIISIISIFIICLLIGNIYLIYFYKTPIKELKIIEETITVDNTISPENTTQGVFLEIKRIHKKGIENNFRKIGNSWKKKPTFNFEAIVDGAIWVGNDINDWDTGYIGWESLKDVEDEQESAIVDFKIFETKKKIFKTEKLKMESYNVIYNFKTGRWSGDDSFNDSDGYGHINGKNYEMWFSLNQFDIDSDGIPFWTENNILGTNPWVDDSKLDPDSDFIPTSWEWKWGYDPFKPDNHTVLDPDLDGLENIEEYKLEKWLANPFYKEIYCEVDFMEKGRFYEIEHVLWKESQWMVMDRFSPHFITLHVDDGWPSGLTNGGGEYLEYVPETIEPGSGVSSEFYKYHFSDERKGVFRYIFIQSGEIGWNYPQDSNWHPDTISLPASRKLYFNMMFPPAITPRLHRLTMAVSFIHEMGHSLGIFYDVINGCDNSSMVGRNSLPPLQKLKVRTYAIKYWDSYESVMNYNKFGQYAMDYSDGSHGGNDFNDWDYIDLTYFQKKSESIYGIGDNYKT